MLLYKHDSNQQKGGNMDTDNIIKFANNWSKMGEYDKRIIMYLKDNDGLFIGNPTALSKVMDRARTGTHDAIMRLEKMNIIIVNRNSINNRVQSFALADSWMDNICKLCESEILNSFSRQKK